MGIVTYDQAMKNRDVKNNTAGIVTYQDAQNMMPSGWNQPTVQTNPTPYSREQNVAPILPGTNTLFGADDAVANRLQRAVTPEQPKQQQTTTVQTPNRVTRDMFDMAEGLVDKYGSYENYLNNIVTDAYKQRQQDQAKAESTYSNPDFTYSSDPQGFAAHYAEQWKQNQARQEEANKLVSQSEVMAAEGFSSMREYNDYLMRGFGVIQADERQQAEQGPAMNAAADLKQMQAEYDALYKPNYGAGNIDLSATPRFINEDGSYSTVDSMSFYDDKTGLEILIPTVVQIDGQWYHVDEDQAIEQYRKTGKYLGAFNTAEDANAYAIQLHQQQEALFADRAAKSAQIRAQEALVGQLISDWQNGPYANYVSERAAYLKEYDFPEYLRDNNATYDEAKSAMDALELEIASLPAGSDEYNAAVRKYNQLERVIVTFAQTTDELRKLRDLGGERLSTTNADAAMYERLEYCLYHNIDPDTDEEYLRLKDEADAAAKKLSKDERIRDAAGIELARRDTEEMVKRVKGTEAEQLFDVLAAYAATGNVDKDTIRELTNGLATIDKVKSELRKQLEKQGYTEEQIDNAFETLTRRGNELRTSRQMAGLENFATSNALAGAAATVLSILVTNPLSPIGLLEAARATYNGSTINTADPNSLFMLPTNATNAIRGGITEAVDSKLFTEAYGIGTSMLDSILASYVPGGSMILAGGAGAQMLNEMTRKGAPLGDALLFSTVAAANEAIWESLSIGQINALKDVPVLTYGDFFANLAKNFGVNLSEEFNTTLANNLFDWYSPSSFSKTNLAIANYMQQINPQTGRLYTKDEAKQRVFVDLAREAVHDGVTGGIEGAFSAALMQALGLSVMAKMRQYVRTNIAEKADTVSLMTDGLLWNPSSRTFQISRELMEQYNAIDGAEALNNFMATNAEKFSELRKQMVRDAMYAPPGGTTQLHRVVAEKIAKGDKTPVHVESENETKLREAQTAAGMSQETMDATRQLILDVVNGKEKLNFNGLDGNTLMSMQFRAVVKAMTGQDVLGDSASKVRASLREIAKDIRSRSITFTTSETVTAQDNLVQPTGRPVADTGTPAQQTTTPSGIPLSDLTRNGWYNAKTAPTEEQTATETPAETAETGTPAETAETKTPEAPAQQTTEQKPTGFRRFVDRLLGRTPAKESTGPSLVVTNRAEEQATQTTKTEQTIPADAQVRIGQERMTREEFIDAATRNGATEEEANELFDRVYNGDFLNGAEGDDLKTLQSIAQTRNADNERRLDDFRLRDNEITERQYNMERALNWVFTDSGVKVRFVPGNVLRGRNGQWDPKTQTLFINAAAPDADTNTGAGVAWVLAHELTHAAKSAIGDTSIVDHILGWTDDDGTHAGVMQRLAESGAITGRYAELATDPEAMRKELDALRDRYVSYYKGAGNDDDWIQRTVTDDFLREEIAGDFFGALLGVNDFNEGKENKLGTRFGRSDLFQMLAGIDPAPLKAAELSLTQKLKAMKESGLRGEAMAAAYDSARKETTDLLRDIRDALQKADWRSEAPDVRESISSLAYATGITLSSNVKTHEISYKINGQEVTEVTKDHVKNHSGVGVMIRLAQQNGYIDAHEADRQYEAMADLMNTILKTQDPELYWNWAGAMIFSAIRSNSDAQYSTTVDFSTVCRKTQDMLTAVSSAMLGRAKQNPDGYGGLTKEEITDLQRRVANAGLQVNCPVCYVFSRWAGVGGILDDINRLQRMYSNVSREELLERRLALEDQLRSRGLVKTTKEGETFENKHIDALTKEKSASVNDLEGQRDILQSMIEKGKAPAGSEERLATLNEDIQHLNSDLKLLGEWQWVKNIATDPNYRAVPAEVLYNLDAGETFAKDYNVVWGWRTTRGSGAGKAILPYSDMRLGDFFVGPVSVEDRAKYNTNPWTEAARGQAELTEDQEKSVASAKRRVDAQNLLGGQRLQSTSDFRYEYALDYFQTFLEMQALGSKAQTYTKVREFVDIICSAGGDCNMSVMPLGRGYNAQNKLVFSNVTGMNIDAALEANRQWDNAQLILVGINDQHIMLALEDSEETGGINIGFIIPYHTSGAKIEGFISELVKNLNEEIKIKHDYRDYTPVQSDHTIKRKIVDEKGKTVYVDARTEEQVAMSDMRRHLLTGRDGNKNWKPSAQDIENLWNLAQKGNADILGRSFAELREIELRALAGDEAAIREYKSWTQANVAKLYQKLWQESGSEYGVRLTGDQAKAVMPHEYWDSRTTRSNAYINGFLFRSYCYNLGLRPRFTGWTEDGYRAQTKVYTEDGKEIKGPDKKPLKQDYGDFSDSTGYWKLLIDRPMYDNNGKYREQQRINLTDFNRDMLMPSYAERFPSEYRAKDNNAELARSVGEQFAQDYAWREGVGTKEAIQGMAEGAGRQSLARAGENEQYNNEQTEVGGPLRTMAYTGKSGGNIARMGGVVGKNLGTASKPWVYFHRNYLGDAMRIASIDPVDYDKAYRILEEKQPGLAERFNYVTYNAGNDSITFGYSPDFDTAREPIAGEQLQVFYDTGKTTYKPNNRQIFHHKWLWVENDYDGFDQEEAWNWSKQWLNTIRPAEDLSGGFAPRGIADGTNIDAWNRQLDYFGLPRDGADERYSLSRNGGTDAEGNPYEFTDMPKYQDYTSAGTSLPSNAPTVYKAVKLIDGWKPGTKNLDIGGGKTEFANQFLGESNVENKILDPYNRKADYNLKAIESLIEDGKYDTVTCANVLNVINSAQSRRNVILEAAKALKPNGKAYFQIYEGVKGQEAGVTKSGYQEARKTATYIDEIKQYFNNVEQWGYQTKKDKTTGEKIPEFKPSKSGNIIVASDPKQNLPRAYWEYEEGKAVKYSVAGRNSVENRLNAMIARGETSGYRYETVKRQLDSLFHAMELEAKGKSDDVIFDSTHWWKDPSDGKWRYEIRDDGADFRPNANAGLRNDPNYRAAEKEYRALKRAKKERDLTADEQTRFDELKKWVVETKSQAKENFWRGGGKIGDVVDHKLLFEAYPDLRDVPFKFGPLDGNIYGEYDPSANSITINEKVIGDARKNQEFRDQYKRVASDFPKALDATEKNIVLSILLHEMQHQIQRVEGFSEGGNNDWMQKLQDKTKAAKDRYRDEAINLGIPDAMDAYNQFRMGESADVIDDATGEVLRTIEPASTGLKDRIDAMNEWIDAAFDAGLLNGRRVLDVENAFEKYAQADVDYTESHTVGGMPANSFKMYQALRGEQEARNTQARQLMDAKERYHNRPQLPEDYKTMADLRKIYDRYFNDGSSRYSIARGQETQQTDRDARLRDILQRMGDLSTDGLGAANGGFATESDVDFDDWYNQANVRHLPLSEEQRNASAGERANRAAYQFPERDSKRKVIQRAAQTIANSPVTDAQMARTIGNAAANGVFSYIPESYGVATDRAKKQISDLGWDGAYGAYKDSVDKGLTSRNITALGIELYNNAVTNKDYYAALDIANLLIKNSHEAAGALGAMRMLNGLDANGRMYMMVRSIENIADSYKKLYPDLTLTIDDQLLRDYRDALINQDEDAQAKATLAIERSIAEQIKPTLWERLNNWRYFAMLANPTTHIRNSLGNLFFAPVRLMKQALKAGLESAFTGKAGLGSNRTTAMLNPLSQSDRQLFMAALRDSKNVMDIIQSGGKQTGPRDRIEKMRQIAFTKVGDAVMKANTNALDWEDTIFSAPAYAEALASFLKARGITGDDFLLGDGTQLALDKGNVDPALLDKAREHAIKEAQKATYRDHNAFSDAIANIGRAGRTKNAGSIARIGSTAMEGVIPFKRTPANIMARAWEYSPAEFLNIALSDIKKLSRAGTALRAVEAQNDGSENAIRAVNKAQENLDAAKSELFDHLSSATTGSLLLGLGMLLRRAGRIVGGEDDDDEEQAAFDKLRGLQEYAFVDNDGNTYTIDWMAPEVLPLFTGVALYDKVFDRKPDEGGFWDSISNVLSGMYEPMLNMSMLSSINDLLYDIKYLKKDQQIPGIMKSVAGSLASQFIPTVLGKIENIGTDKKYSTFIDRESQLGKTEQYFIGGVANKIPGWEYNQIVNYDAWGREQSTGDVLQRVVQNMLSPGKYQANRSTPYDDELQRLKDLGFSVFPEKAGQTQKVSTMNPNEDEPQKRYMTAQEYELYTKTQGETQFKLIGEILDSDAYAKLTDKVKADVIKDAYTAAKTAAENAVLRSAGLGDKLEESKAEQVKMPESTYILAKAIYDNAETPKGYNTTNAGNTPKWAKMLAVLDDDSFDNKDKLAFVNANSGLKESFKTFSAARTYYLDQKQKDKK
jgi:hypothetical protein